MNHAYQTMLVCPLFVTLYQARLLQ